jgi:hypothetical protein
MFVLDKNPCNIPLKYRHPMKKSDHMKAHILYYIYTQYILWDGRKACLIWSFILIQYLYLSGGQSDVELRMDTI